MRARVKQEPVLQANSAKYGAMRVQQHTPDTKRRDYGSRELQHKADEAMKELNNLFQIN